MSNLASHEVVQFFEGLGSEDLFDFPEKVPDFFGWSLPTPRAFEEFYELVGAQNKNLNPTFRWWLSQNTNYLRSGAMRAYWGSRYEVHFKNWLPSYIEQSESGGLKLPETAGVKTSGPTAFFGLTSGYAVGFIPREALIEQLVVRVVNGIWFRRDLKTLRVPLAYLGKRPSSVSPDFAPAFAKFLISLQGVPWEDAPPTVKGATEDSD